MSRLADTVGAGDAFTAGLLWALPTLDPGGLRELAPGELAAALAAAARVARQTCERAGADPPWLAEL
ncbi:MAG: PfkB family carbohydrate kinase [Mycobacteriales bacterium]